MENFRLQELKVSYFRGYYEKDNIFNFNGDKKLYILVGPNGFGKTSFFDAIEWLFLGEINRIKRNLDEKKDAMNPTEQTLINNIDNEKRKVKASVELKMIMENELIELKRESMQYKKDYNQENTRLYLKINDEWSPIEQEWIQNKFTNKTAKHFNFSEKFSDYHFCSHERNLRVFHEKRADIYSRLAILFGENKLNNYKNNIKLVLDRITNDYEKFLIKYNSFLENNKNNISIESSDNIEEIIEEYNKNLILEERLENIFEKNLHARLKTLELLEYLISNKEKYHSYTNEYELRKIQKTIYNFKEKVVDIFFKEKNLINYLKGDLPRLRIDREEIESEAYKINKMINGLVDDKKYDINIDEVILLLQKYNNINSQIVRGLDLKIREYITEETVLNQKIKIIKSKSDNYKKANMHLINLINYAKKYVVENETIDKCPLCKQTLSLSELKKSIEESENILNAQDVEVAMMEDQLKIIKSNKQENVKLVEKHLIRIREALMGKSREINDNLKKEGSLEVLKNELNKYNIELKDVNEETIINITANMNRDLEKLRIRKNGQDVEENMQEVEKFIREYEQNREKMGDINEIYEFSIPIINDKIDCLKSIIQNQNYNELKEKLNELEITKEKFDKKIKKAKNIEKNINNTIKAIEKLNKNDLEEPINYIYKKINRHTNFGSININIVEGKTDRMDTTIESGKKELNISNVLSSGQVTTVALSFFLGIALKQNSSKFRAYFLDDPVQHMDDLNILSLFDLLKVHILDNSLGNQLFISTCDEDVEKLLTAKMEHNNIGVQKFVFESYGKYINC